MHRVFEVNKEFTAIYRQHFLNGNSIQYIPAPEDGRLLILCPSIWKSMLEPFRKWKIQKGIYTEICDLDLIGNNASAIKNYIADYYAHYPLTHVLLVGDHNFVATPLLPFPGGASDPSYGYLSGNDSYSEVFIGRFSAENAVDVKTQVDRVINYEQFPDTAFNLFDTGVCIGSNLGPGDDNEMDWEHEANLRSALLGFTYSTVKELYDGTHPGTTDLPGDPINVDLFNLLQNGVSILNYTGHGSSTGFSTTGFSNADVNMLSNVNKLPFIWSVGCTNGNLSATLFKWQQYSIYTCT